MEYFVSPAMILEQISAEQRRETWQNALIGEALRSTEHRLSIRHTLAVAFRELALRIDSQTAATNVASVVTQS